MERFWFLQRAVVLIVLFLFVSVFFPHKSDNLVVETDFQNKVEPTSSPEKSGIQGSISESRFVIRVVDGDTIILDNNEPLRYIGIDAPETSDGQGCYAEESERRNKELVLGKKIRLEKDISETDGYGRLLRYVYADGVFVNETLVREGYATVATYPPDVKHTELFRQAETKARHEGRGLWSACEEHRG